MTSMMNKFCNTGALMICLLAISACTGPNNRDGEQNVYYQSRPGSSPWRGYYYRPVYIDPDDTETPDIDPDYPEAVPLPEPPAEIPDFGAPDIDFGDY